MDKVSGMPEFLERFMLWLNTKEGKKLFRYSMVSVISTGVSFTVLFLVYGVGRVWSEVPSTIFANVVATFPSYWLNRSWAWGKSGRSHLMKEVVPFWAMAALGIAFSVVGATAARHLGTDHSHLVKTALVLAANLVSFGVFWVAKLMLFNRLFHVPSLLEEIDEHVEHESEASDVQLR
jgi:putative flippase GtrA